MGVEDDFRRVVGILRGWGINVREESGAYGRNNGTSWSSGKPVGHVNHHYVCSMNPAQSYIDSLVANLVSGRVINWFVDVHGRAYFIASGPENHAGTGNQSVLDQTRRDQPPTSNPASGQGSINGNSHYSGMEAQHPGDSTPWPDPMLNTLVAINAAQFIVWGYSSARAINHSEWTNRKIDMSAWGGTGAGILSGEELRRRVAARMGSTAPELPEPPIDTPDPAEDDDMPRRILTIFDAQMNPTGQALDGPTGVVPLYTPDEAAAVQAVIDSDDMVNLAQIDVYNAVLARSQGFADVPRRVWDDHFEGTPGGGSASMGDIVAATYDVVVGQAAK